MICVFIFENCGPGGTLFVAWNFLSFSNFSDLVVLGWIEYYEFMMLFLLTKRSRGSPSGRNTWEFCMRTMTGEVVALRRRKIPRRRSVAMAGSENVGDRSNIVLITCLSFGDNCTRGQWKNQGELNKKPYWIKITYFLHKTGRKIRLITKITQPVTDLTQ